MLHVRDFGSGAPVLALHGLNGHGGRYADLAQRTGLRLICPDLRGHGGSTHMPPWHLDQHAADVLETFDGTIDVIGYSFGGAVAVRAAQLAPQRFGKLVLLDPSIGLSPEFVEPKARWTFTEDESYLDPAEAVTAILGVRDQTREDAEREVAGELAQSADGRWRWRTSRLAVVNAFSEATRLPDAPTHPTLLVRTALNPEGSRAFAAVCENAAHIRIETLECGHRLLIERPAETAALIRDFL